MARQCEDCGKPISRSAKRCKSCTNVARWASGLYDKPKCKEAHRRGVRAACQCPETKRRKSEAAKKSWQDSRVWEKHSRSMRAAHASGRHDNSEAMKAAWSRGAFDDVFTPEIQERRTKAIREASQRPEIREIKSKAAKKVWQRSEYQEQISQARKAAWENGTYDNRPNPWDDPEYRQSQIERMLGPNNPNWVGGISKEPYGEEWTRQLKEYIRERDDHQCVVCRTSENGRAHDCHHLDYDKQNNDPTNLVTLCIPCHRRTNYNRRFWRTMLAPIAVKRERR